MPPCVAVRGLQFVELLFKLVFEHLSFLPGLALSFSISWTGAEDTLTIPLFWRSHAVAILHQLPFLPAKTRKVFNGDVRIAVLVMAPQEDW